MLDDAAITEAHGVVIRLDVGRCLLLDGILFVRTLALGIRGTRRADLGIGIEVGIYARGALEVGEEELFTDGTRSLPWGRDLVIVIILVVGMIVVRGVGPALVNQPKLFTGGSL